MKKIQINSDEETVLLFEVASDVLVKYFYYEMDDAIELMNNFFEEFGTGNPDIDDLYFHHDGPYQLACKVYYCHVFGTLDGWVKWLRANGHWELEPQRTVNIHYMKKLGLFND